jgi:hypothetical protein
MQSLDWHGLVSHWHKAPVSIATAQLCHDNSKLRCVPWVP